MIENVTLYNFKKPTIKIMKGTLTKEKYFRIFRSYEDPNTFWRCCVDPGVVQDRVFWLLERDDEKAKKIISDYLHFKIKQCEHQLDNHLYTLSQLNSQFFHSSI